jgi:hypothetical protein
LRHLRRPAGSRRFAPEASRARGAQDVGLQERGHVDNQAWTLLVQIVGTIISGAALLAVVISLQQVNRSLRTNAVGKIYSEIHEVHHVFIQYPQLRPFFFHDALISEGDEEYMRCRSVAEMYLDIFEHVYQLREHGFNDTETNWTQYIGHMCDSSLFLCNYLDENIDLIFPEELRRFLQSKIHARLQRAADSA